MLPPRDVTHLKEVITGVNHTKIAEYGAMLGGAAGELGLTIAMQYAVLERSAAPEGLLESSRGRMKARRDLRHADQRKVQR